MPVVFLTAFAEDATLERAKLAEPYGYVLKPYAERELRIVLEMALYKHRIETRLRDSEDRYRNLVGNLQTGVLLLDPQGKVLLVNDRAVELLGASREQLVGQNLLDTDWNAVHEDGAPLLPGDHPVARCIATRAPVLDVTMGIFRPRTQDRRWLLVSANPRLNPDGSLREVICTASDITRRKHVELELIAGREALRESVMHTQAILDNVVDAVITINRHGVIESFNRAATSIFGHSAKEAVGHNVSMLMPDHDRLHHDGYLQHYHDTGETRVIGKTREMQARRKDGQVFPVSLAVSRISYLGQVT